MSRARAVTYAKWARRIDCTRCCDMYDVALQSRSPAVRYLPGSKIGTCRPCRTISTPKKLSKEWGGKR